MLGDLLLRGSWAAQGPSVPGTLGGTGTSVGYYGEPGVRLPVPLWHKWLSTLLPVWGGVGPMWWHWVTWCGFPAVPGDAVSVFPPPPPPLLPVAPRLPW